jgi:multiple sugar transport system permease protein
MSAASGQAGALTTRPSQAAVVTRRDPWRAVGTVARYLVLVIVLLFCLFPILWVIGTSIKLPGEYMRNPPVWIPQDPTLVHFQNVMKQRGNLALKNSIIIAGGATVWRPTAWRDSTPAAGTLRSGSSRSG